jgi:hypothetical protein
MSKKFRLAEDSIQWQAVDKINCTDFQIAVPTFLLCTASTNTKTEFTLKNNRQSEL